MFQQVIISLGSNVGKRAFNLKKAALLCETYLGTIESISSIYETAAWGIENQKAFYNQVIIFKSNIEPTEIMRLLLKIETEMGRVRAQKWGPRNIDLDILFVDQIQLNIPELQIPHPQIQNRLFVLTPLCEVAPNFMHPILLKSVTELMVNCEDKLAVKKIKNR